MQLRTSNIQKLQQHCFDVLVIGGGINGAVAAAALAAKGVKVALIERGDFAGETSSNSSNLAWGGIKYLESGELMLVNKLCQSRNQLLREYPSRVQEIRFFTTIQRGFRLPVWTVYLGTLLYWAIGRFFTKPPRYLTKRGIQQLEPTINTDQVQAGFEYSDCYLHDNDSRFVFNFVRDSLNWGCIAANYVGAAACSYQQQLWQTQVQDTITGATFTIRSRALINACGPWVDQLNQASQQTTRHRHLFSKGVHLIVDRITPAQRVLTFFASDGRLFFVIPLGPRTCIGTTDTQVDQPDVSVSAADRQFILDNANQLLRLPQPLTAADIVAERCGVRPLAVSGGNTEANWVKLSRKHAIDIDRSRCHLSIFGGKLTDCLNVGEEVVAAISDLGITVPYPQHKWHGEPGDDVRQEFLHQARLMALDDLTAATASEPLSQRLWRRYGDKAFVLLDRIREDPQQAQQLIAGAEYLRCEIEMAAKREMITKLSDFMRRRSKIELVTHKRDLLTAPGLAEACEILFGEQAQEKLREYLQTLAE